MGQESFGGEPEIPTGHIVMWAGLLADIPTGWALCDGNNGTPNLLGRFVKEVSNDTTDPGATGGTTSNTLSVEQLGSHTHNGPTDSAGQHKHSYTCDYNYVNETGNDWEWVPDSPTWGNARPRTETNGAHTHADPGRSGMTGGDGSYENQPAYYEMAFIMKT